MRYPITILALFTLCCGPSAGNAAPFDYQENFDGLTTGTTQPYPGAPGQGGWYSEAAIAPAFGEIENTVSKTGNALHEFTSAVNPEGQQTIDRHNFSPVDVNAYPLVTLSVDFYAHTSDLSAVNIFHGGLSSRGGPFPGFDIVEVTLEGGNGTPKSQTGVAVGIPGFNGVDNNERLPLTVGQNLAFDTWHSMSISLNQVLDRYISVTVDGQTQDLSAFMPVRSFDGAQWLRGHSLELLEAQIIPDAANGIQTNDSVYWDNIQLTAVPEPTTWLLAAIGGLGLVMFAGRGRRPHR